MKIRTALALGLSAFAIAACATAVPVGGESVDSRYVTGGGTWDTGGGITVAVRAFERDGVTVVCGVWTTDRQSTQSIELNRWVVETGAVEIAGDRVLQNLIVFNRIPYSGDITGEPANCVTASKPWKAAYADADPVIRFPRLAFATDDIAPSNTVIFRPGGRDRIIR